jgi:sigma-B regulation protein RsbU (phosphoserine phosphatase)
VGRGFGRDRLAAVSAPMVAADGRFFGVVQGAIQLASLERLMQVAASQPGVELLVVDPSKRVAFASPGMPFAPLDTVAAEGWIDEGTDLPVRFVPLRLPGAPLFDTLVFERDTPEGWHVVVLTSRWHLLSRALVDLALLALLVTLVVFAALRAGRLQARRVTEPLRDLGRRLDTLSLAERPALPATRANEAELATLEDAFARMAVRLGEAWERLRDEFATETMLREELAQSIAARRALDAELSIAAGIQQSMVPGASALAGVSPQLDVAGILEPARAVGGDFFNVLAIDDRYTCFFIGDVSDKGVAAALFMARVATLLEVVARRGEPPGRLLSIVAREIARNNPSEMFATVLCGVIDARVGTLSLASAGHDPPVVLRSDRRIERPPLETGPALGFEPGVEYPEWHLRLRPEDALVCWTDGLTEAPDAAGREFGGDGLDAVLARGATDASELVARVSASALLHTGGAPAHDDLTLLVLRRMPLAAPMPARKPPVVLEMPNRIAVLPVLSAALDGALAEEGVAPSVRADIALVMEEVLSNTVRHGYPDGRRDTIRVEARREGERLHLLFDDGGSAWNPLEHALPDVDADLAEREIGGLGVLLVRELSESAQYQRIEGRNRLRLVLRLDAPEEVTA